MTAGEQLAHAPRGLTATGWRLDPTTELEFDAWREYGRRFAAVERAMPWVIGDWVNYGERAYGEKYSEAIEITGLEVGTLMNQAYVAARIPISRRREALSWSHHYEVAALEPPQADALLRRAEAGGWSRNRLRGAVKGLDAGEDKPVEPHVWPDGPAGEQTAATEQRTTLVLTGGLHTRSEFCLRVAELKAHARELGLRLAESAR